MSEIKVYGLDSSLIHDADPKDGFVVDVVRFSDYVELEKKYLFIVGETSRVIGERNDIRAAMHRAFHYLMLGRHVDAENAIKCVTQRGEVPTQATDAAINEIKAQTIETAADDLSGQNNIGAYEHEAMYAYAASLRGEQNG
ncbi:hypothetical protein RSF11_004381 [Yersinia enterocolitica]|uniref:Uncharacterized protein n=1 Tax=Yersinia enterocolitica TaxID=630 RepID=A0AAD2Z9I9_YEREN|nr:hypothetical protein [Yersinia enterocolitica]